MRKGFKLLFFLSLICLCYSLSAQDRALGIGYGMGYTIPNHPRFPKLNGPSHYFETSWTSSPEISRYWSKLNPKAILNLTASLQTFGNNAAMGEAIGLTPLMSFNLLKPAPFSMQLQMGWGIAFLTKKFNSFFNTTNIVIGTNLNSYVSGRLQLAYRVGDWEPFMKVSLLHYSNGNAMSPNLGINIPAFQTGILWHYDVKKTAMEVDMSMLPEFKRRFSPFVQLGLGMTATVSRGPFFPVYVVNSGAQWHYKRSRSLWAGLEYSFNSSVYQFFENNGSSLYERKDFDRYAFWLGHEWLFGRFGFFAMGGLYLNKHVYQRSLIPTQTGLNFYPRLPYKYLKNQAWIGVHIRAYFGLADYVMLQMGYSF
jgi:hypothetical protein